MYAKIYEQIFDSSIAENYQVRHVFEDLLKLADKDGTVNRTHEAIARRTNVPLEIVRMAIAELEKPDPRSQSKEADGRRIVRLEEDRDWGWRIVNHGYYRSLKTEEDRRQGIKERVRKHREDKDKREKSVTSVTDSYSLHMLNASALPEGSAEGRRKTDPRPESVDVVIAYATELGMPADEGRAWWDWFSSNGWKVGKAKTSMQDWKACVRTWKRSWQQKHPKTRESTI